MPSNVLNLLAVKMLQLTQNGNVSGFDLTFSQSLEFDCSFFFVALLSVKSAETLSLNVVSTAFYCTSKHYVIFLIRFHRV